MKVEEVDNLEKKKIVISKKPETKAVKVKKEKKENPVKVGDVFHSSWGYDMTINDFYKVIDVLGSKKIKLKQLKNKVLSGNHFAGEETFHKNEFKKDAEEFTRMVNANYSKPVVKINSYNQAFKIDPKNERTYY